jgi:Family of unknown function (DUF6529)
VEAARTRNAPALLLAGIALVGAGVALAIGIYANEHDPTGKSVLGDGLFFSSTINMKVWLATAVAAFALIQVTTALWMYGHLPLTASIPGWVPPVHRLSGLLAFLISLPVAYHCTWALGFQFDDAPTRVAAHSLLGCFFYGAFASKMLFLRVDRLPGVILPVVGGAVFATVIAIWFTSAYWFFDNFGFPEF